MPYRPKMHRATVVRESRPSARKRGYTRTWEKARLAYLRVHPLCVVCERESRLTPATVVDHVIPHRGDSYAFWDEANWQSLCGYHHNLKTQSQ